MRADRRAVRLYALALCLGVPAPSAAAGSPAPMRTLVPSRLAAVQAEHDAGRVAVGAPVTHTYEIRNTGDRPAKLEAHAACGCTTTDYDEEIAPGALGKLTAVLDTTNVRGKVTKVIRVTTEDPAETPLVLTIVAEAVPILDVAPSDRPLLRGPIGAVAPVTLTITSPDATPFAVTRVAGDDTVTATLEPRAAAAPATEPWRVTLVPRADLAIGSRSARVTVTTTHPEAAELVLKPTVVVSGPISATPPRLELRGAATSGDVRIASASPATAFAILEATTSDAAFTPEVVAVDAGRTYDVRVRYARTPAHGATRAVLKIRTDVPGQPLVLVPLAVLP